MRAMIGGVSQAQEKRTEKVLLVTSYVTPPIAHILNEVMNYFKQKEFLECTDKKSRRLIQKEKLLKRWTIVYAAHIKPKHLVGQYKAPNPEWWEGVDLPKHHGYWGGEVAAAKLLRNFEFKLQFLDVVHPILIYANLLDSGDPKNIETAQIIYEKYLVPVVLED